MLNVIKDFSRKEEMKTILILGHLPTFRDINTKAHRDYAITGDKQAFLPSEGNSSQSKMSR